MDGGYTEIGGSLESKSFDLIEGTNMYQQGDINIEICTVPQDAHAAETSVVAEGSTTGHKHQIEGGKFRMLALGERIFAEILSGDCRIVHDEHLPINLPIGEYEFLHTIEYDHFAEEARRVLD